MRYFTQDGSRLIWRNVDTGETYAGGRKVTLPAPLDRIPVLERI